MFDVRLEGSCAQDWEQTEKSTLCAMCDKP